MSRRIACLPRDAGFHRAVDDRMDQVVRWLTEGPQDRKILSMRLQCGDRQMRIAIEELRRRGQLIVTLHGYYRLAASRDEYEEWKRLELKSRLGTFHEQLRHMDAQADRVWPAEQLKIAI